MMPISQSLSRGQWVRLERLSLMSSVGQSPPGESYERLVERAFLLINGPVEFSEGPFGITVLNQYTTAPTKLCKKGDLTDCALEDSGLLGSHQCLGDKDLMPDIGSGSCSDSAAVRRSIRSVSFIWLWRDQILRWDGASAFPSVSRRQIEDLSIPSSTPRGTTPDRWRRWTN